MLLNCERNNEKHDLWSSWIKPQMFWPFMPSMVQIIKKKNLSLLCLALKIVLFLLLCDYWTAKNRTQKWVLPDTLDVQYRPFQSVSDVCSLTNLGSSRQSVCGHFQCPIDRLIFLYFLLLQTSVYAR
jgi:hypothetical protein